MNKKIRIVLADDHPIMTEGLKLTISSWEEFEVIGIASDGEKAVEMSVKLLPDLVIDRAGKTESIASFHCERTERL